MIAQVTYNLPPRLCLRCGHSHSAGTHGLVNSAFRVIRDQGNLIARWSLIGAIGAQRQAIYLCHFIGRKSQGCGTGFELSIKFTFMEETRLQSKRLVIECQGFRNTCNIYNAVSKVYFTLLVVYDVKP